MMDPEYSITSEPQPEPEKSTSDRVRELFGQSMGYLATAADEGLLGAPSFVARKIGAEDALKRVKELNPYKASAEISGDIASMVLPTGLPSKLAAGGAKLFGKILPKTAPFMTSKAAQILANSESLAKLRGLKGMAARGAVNAAWQSAPREAMKEQPEWGSVPLAATMGAVTGPVVGKVVEKMPITLEAIKDIIGKHAATDFGYDDLASLGFRFLPTRKKEYKIGEILKPSYRWEDGRRTREILEGTSALGIEDDLMKSIRRMRQQFNPMMGTYSGDEIALIKGLNKGYGEDPGEILLKDPEIIEKYNIKDFLEAFKDIK